LPAGQRRVARRHGGQQLGVDLLSDLLRHALSDLEKGRSQNQKNTRRVIFKKKRKTLHLRAKMSSFESTDVTLVLEFLPNSQQSAK